MQTLLSAAAALAAAAAGEETKGNNEHERIKSSSFCYFEATFFIPGFRVAPFSQLSPAGWSMNR